MAIILNIDTALETASVCLSSDEKILSFAENKKQTDHASWLHSAIDAMLKKENIEPGSIDAIAVSIGPGSYTGLRIGLSAAKGLCYALNIPLITIGTLELIAFAVKEEATELICALIDARRMEVFTAVYDKKLNTELHPCAMIIDDKSFSELLVKKNILFCGSGRKKLQNILTHPHAFFSDTEMTAAHLSKIAYQYYREEKFADLAYTEPLYLKEFYSPARKDS
ncbi:MAG TPA: tRNA (adenosine(37)-N6)-threonylcarbamoyltransferase complex dimerization subunit type 1 TsaB [Chitinophagaceae bacterium]